MSTRQEHQHCQVYLRFIHFVIALKWAGKSMNQPLVRKPFAGIAGAGLSQDCERQRIEFGAAGGPVTHGPGHPFDDHGAMWRSDLDLRPFDRAKVPGAGNFGPEEMSAVNQRRVSGEQLRLE